MQYSSVTKAKFINEIIYSIAIRLLSPCRPFHSYSPLVGLSIVTLPL